MSDATRKPARSTQSTGKEGKEHGQGREGGQEDRRLKLAEWVSLTVSLLIIVGLAGYLVYQATLPSGPYVPVEASLKLVQVRQESGRFILPVEVRNAGERTLREVNIEVSSASGKEDLKREVTIDYLAENSRETTYLYYDEDPRRADLQATAHSYRLD